MRLHIPTFILCFVAVAAAESIFRRTRSSDSSPLHLDVHENVEVKGSGQFMGRGVHGRTAMQEGPAQDLLHHDGTSFTKAQVNTCNDDYPLGVPGKNQCADAGFDYVIISPDMCIDASNRAGVTHVHSHFIIEEVGTGGEKWWYRYPMGCIKLLCSEAHGAFAAAATDAENAMTGYCYFFNPIGSPPPEGNLAGVPVCYRPKLILGTLEYDTTSTTTSTTTISPATTSNDTSNATSNATSSATSLVDTSNVTNPSPLATCRAGFQVINNSWDCRVASECLGLCRGDSNFAISQYVNSLFDYYPEGCFREEHTQCVYFNERPPNWPDPPKWPVGTPICNVTHQTLANDWPTTAAPTPPPPPTPAPTEAPTEAPTVAPTESPEEEVKEEEEKYEDGLVEEKYDEEVKK